MLLEKTNKSSQRKIYSVLQGFLLLIILLLFFACSDPDNNTKNSSAKNITSFVFKAADNGFTGDDVTADIDQTTKTITANLPSAANIAKLKPIIRLSTGASVNLKSVETQATATAISKCIGIHVIPASGETKNFTNSAITPINYRVTAEDGSTKTYAVRVTVD